MKSLRLELLGQKKEQHSPVKKALQAKSERKKVVRMANPLIVVSNQPEDGTWTGLSKRTENIPTGKVTSLAPSSISNSQRPPFMERKLSAQSFGETTGTEESAVRVKLIEINTR